MFYLTMYSTHFIYGYMASDMVKDHSDSEKGNPLPPHRLLFPISSKGSFYMHHPTDRIAHTTAFVTPVVEHWLEREIAHWVHPMKDRSDDPSHHERTLLPRSYISLPELKNVPLINISHRYLYSLRIQVTCRIKLSVPVPLCTTAHIHPYSCYFWFTRPMTYQKLLMRNEITLTYTMNQRVYHRK